MCWGSNSYGELGDGTATVSSAPVYVTAVSDVTAMALGQYFTCALLSAGTVSCWGANNLGQLGDGTSTEVDKAMSSALQTVRNTTASGTAFTTVTADGIKVAVAVLRPVNGSTNGTSSAYAISLPDSSTTVTVQAPSTLPGNTVAIVVTTAEVSASRFSNSSAASNSSTKVPLPPPQLVSSVVTVQ
eukprot:gene14490-biopygen6582